MFERVVVAMNGRTANNPKRRIAPADRCTAAQKAELVKLLEYTGSALHKRRPGDYGFHPPTNPRPHKSLCDGAREVLKSEAVALMKKGLEAGLFSDFEPGSIPKYIWSVSAAGEVFEAKTNPRHERLFHGYRLGNDDDMRRIVAEMWEKRCRTA